MASATNVKENFELRLLSDRHSDYQIKSKWDHTCLDKHLQVSVMTGIIDKFHGASNFINDKTDASHVNRTFVCRAKSREERLNLQTLANPRISSLFDFGEEKATHVVIGVFYGAEFYCVLSKDLNGDEESRKDVEDNLSELVHRWKNSLAEGRDFLEIKEGEAEKLNHLKCRLYNDLQPETVRECNVSDAYKQCAILIEQVQENDNVSVPISVLLCPLEEIPVTEYFDVDVDLIGRCYRVYSKLEQICLKADALRSAVRKDNRSRLRRFVDAVAKYQEMLKKNLKDAVIEARKTNKMDKVERIADVAETHLLFRPSRLKRWLFYERAELEMMEKLAIGTKEISFLADWKEFDPKTVVNKQFALLLIVPSLNEMFRDVTKSLENFVDLESAVFEGGAGDQDGDTTEDEEEKNGIPFHHVEFRRKLLQSKLRELAEHIDRNKEMENQFQFFVSNDRGQGTKCWYILYDYTNSRKDPSKTTDFQLPKPPTNVRICPKSSEKTKKAKTSLESIRVEWDESEQLKDYPFQYLVEYRSKGSSSDYWAKKKTTEANVSISVNPGAEMEIRVAAGNLMGLSGFSPVVHSNTEIDMVELEEIETPKKVRKQPQMANGSTAGTPDDIADFPTGLRIGLVTQTSAEIEWNPTTNPSSRFSYRIRYRTNGIVGFVLRNVASNETYCHLDGLEPNTNYTVDILVVLRDGTLASCLPSQSIELKTMEEDVRFSEIVFKWCRRVESGDEMPSYAIPLTNSAANRYVFGKPGNKDGHKTILLVGASGSGKTSLINGIANHIFGVEWDDPVRYKLDPFAGQTEFVKVYDIHHYEGFNVGCSLTIIDTPGYGEDLDKNQEITKMIRTFFEDKEGEQQLNLVGFVKKSTLPNPTATDKFIYQSMVSIFGEDVKDNLIHLLTFADHKEVPPLQSNVTCRFDNFAFFCFNEIPAESDEELKRKFDLGAALTYNNFLWYVNQKNLCCLFSCLDSTTSKSLSSSKNLLEEKKRIATTVDGLETLITVGLAKMEELRTIKKAITNQEAQVNIQLQMAPRKFEVPFGSYVTNCTKCKITCHKSCSIEEGKVDCDVMDRSKSISVRTCLVCPGNCLWSLHVNEPFRWEFVQQTEVTSAEAIKRRYENKLKRELTVGELIAEVDEEADANERAVLDRFMGVVKCNERLDQMDERRVSLTTLQLINQRIVGEKKEKSGGFEERIKSLKKIRLLDVVNFLNSL